MAKIDHFVYFHPNLQEGIDYFQDTFGLKAEIGGQHIGRGTWNALFALEGDAYFEIISPDPKQVPFTKSRWMGLDNFKHPQLIRWAVAVDNLKEAYGKVNMLNLPIGNIEHGSRKLTNGETLQWQLTTPAMHNRVEPIPFFIEWASVTHPSNGAIPQATIKSVLLKGKNVGDLTSILEQLPSGLTFEKDTNNTIELTLQTRKGLFMIN